MNQIAVKLPDELLRKVDGLVNDGHFESRSAAIRAGLTLIVSRARNDLIDEAFRRGFAAVPETAEEMADAHRLAIESIEEEPWEPWW